MLLVRPVAVSDHAEILALAREAGIGMTSLPPDAEVLEHKIQRSVASFAGEPEAEKDESFLFVLEDTDAKKLVGTCRHRRACGPAAAHFIPTNSRPSCRPRQRLSIYSLQRVLHMVNDYTGATEIGSLFLLPAYRRDGIGKFLSRCRYLMLARISASSFPTSLFPKFAARRTNMAIRLFTKTWRSIFSRWISSSADFINATQGGQFISDLMPKYPIYVNLLDARAQAVIGVPMEASQPALQLLEHEGFRHQGYIDVFDGGPTMQAERVQIRTVRESRRAALTALKSLEHAPLFMVVGTSLESFRMGLVRLEDHKSGVALEPQAAEMFGLRPGDDMRFMRFLPI